jgi:hypothetical protein
MSLLFGDNKSVVNSSAQPHTKLHKRQTALLFHRVREAIAAGIVGFFHIPGDSNPADILSQHWGYQQVCHFCSHSCFAKVIPWTSVIQVKVKMRTMDES